VLARAGRHDVERDVRIWFIAEGVKGLFRIRRDSFVVCALRTEEASERTARGSGEVVMVAGFAAGGCLRRVSKLSRRDLVEMMDFWRVRRCSFSMVAVISCFIQIDSIYGVNDELVSSVGKTFGNIQHRHRAATISMHYATLIESFGTERSTDTLRRR
jgi:hypothetical protein